MAVPLKDFKVNGKGTPGKGECDPSKAPMLYVPMESKMNFADGTPVNSLMVKHRRDILKEWFGEKWKDGALGTAYKAWLYAVISLVAVLVTYGINLWVAAFFAYLTGYFWSQVLINYAWSVVWYKGKAAISTK